MPKTPTILAVAAAALLAACSNSERVTTNRPASTVTAPSATVITPAPSATVVTPAPSATVITPAPGAAIVTPGAAVTPVAVSGSSLAVPIGSSKFGFTSDCNEVAGGTVQGRTSATTMLDCAPLGRSMVR